MKYHTTVSTIIVSLLVLLCFLLVAGLCVFSLGLESPGIMLVDAIISNISNDTDFSFSFGSIERNLSSRIIIYDVEIFYRNERLAHIDSIMLYQNPFSLIWTILTKHGRLNVDISGVDLNLRVLAGEESEREGENALSLDDVNAFLQNLESYTPYIEDMAFYALSYSINVEDFDLHWGSLSFNDFRMHLRLDERLALDSFVFNTPHLQVELLDLHLAADNLSLNFTGGERYRTRLSVDSLEAVWKALDGRVEELALNLEFDNFASLDVRNLPLVLSTGSLEGNCLGYSFSLSGLFAQVQDEGVSLVLLPGKVESEAFTVNFRRSDLRIVPQDDELYNLYFSLSEELDFAHSSGEAEFTLGSATGSLSLGQTLNFSLELVNLGFEHLDSYSSGLYSSVSTPSFLISGQANGDVLFVEGEGSFTGLSTVDFFDNSYLDISVSAYIEENGFSGGAINIRELDFATLPYIITAAISYNDGKFDGYLEFGDEINLEMVSGATNRISLGLNSVSLNQFSPIIEVFAPGVRAYIGENTSITGSLNYTYDENFNGSFFSSFAFSSIQFNNFTFGLASNLEAEISNEEISIRNFTISSRWVRMAYTGSISRERLLPEGTLVLEMTDSGNRLMNLDFALDNESEYTLNLTSLYFPNSHLIGSINWERDGVVSSAGELKSGNTSYNFDLGLDFNNSRADLVCDGLVLAVDFSHDLDIDLTFTGFMLPNTNPGSQQSSINGNFHTFFDFAAQEITGGTRDFVISSIGFIFSHPDIGFDLTFSNSEVRFDNIFLFDEYEPYTGTAVFLSNGRRFALTLGNESERINLSLILAENDYSGILTLENVSTDRFGLEGSVLDTSLLGRGESIDDFSFSGILYLASGPESGTPYSLSGDIIIDNNGFSLNSLSYITENLEVSSYETSFSASTGRLASSFSLVFTKENRDRDYPVSASLDLVLELEPYASLVDSFMGIVSNINEISLDGSLRINELNIDNLVKVEERNIDFTFTPGMITLDGNFIAGLLDYANYNADLTFLDNSIITGRIHGSFDPSDVYINADDINFNLAATNWLYPVPLISFDNEAWVYGTFLIYGSYEDTHIYGNGGTNGFDMRVFWVENARLHIGSIQLSIVDNFATTGMTPVIVIDEGSWGLHQTYAVAQAQLSNANILDYFNIEVWIPERDDAIHVFVPIAKRNMQIRGDATGYFNLYSDLETLYLSGNFLVDNTVFSIGMDTLPSWWGSSRFQVNNNYNVTLGKNCSFVMPLGDSPIIQAYFNENDTFSFYYDTKSGDNAISGTLSFRSGEIYYFQKNFFITEGSFVFPHSESGLLTPRISLRARLRDYDADGDRVDIYLVLNGSSLDDISPRFESTPQLSIEEIMEILGDSLLSTNMYGDTNLGIAASIASTGIDVLNRVGILDTGYGDLNRIIRDSLGIDIFSIRTRVVENFLLDTIFPELSYNFSPLAMYLNNTSIYLGKYISKNFYLQALFYLEARDFISEKSSFLSDDLTLDLEISLEWETPLGTISFFSTPENLSLYSFAKNIGIRYTNTINW